MTKSKADPAPKPDHIRSLRDLAANFVRAIDGTALEYESVATADLTERVACLVALHDMEKTEAELSKTPNADLRQRLNLLRQVSRTAQDCNDWSARHMSNGELKKRIEYYRLFIAADADFDALTDERLEEVHRKSGDIIRDRARAAKFRAKADAKAEALRTRLQVVEEEPDIGEEAA
jgi:hypothetical protein